MNNDIVNLKKRLIYRSQDRGTKEMDKLIGSFVKSHIDQFDNNELKDLEDFLEVDDDILYKFYNEQNTLMDIKPNNVINLFKNFVYKK